MSGRWSSSRASATVARSEGERGEASGGAGSPWAPTSRARVSASRAWPPARTAIRRKPLRRV